MKPRHLALGAALLAAAGFAVFGDKTPNSQVAEAVVRGAPAAPAAASAVSSANTRANAGASNTGAITGAHTGAQTGAQTGAHASAKGAPEPAILRLVPRETLIPDSADALGGPDSVFLSQNWMPPPPPPPPAAPPPPPPPPSAPPLPFTYLGKSVGEGAWEVYLARGDKTYIVRNQMVVDGVYRVDAIAPPTITFTYLPLNQVQQLNIGVFD